MRPAPRSDWQQPGVGGVQPGWRAARDRQLRRRHGVGVFGLRCRSADPDGPGDSDRQRPVLGVFSPSGGLLATANYRGDTVSVFSVSGGGQLTPVSLLAATGSHPLSVAFSPSGGLLATANLRDDTMSIFAVSGGGQLTPVDVATPTGIRPGLGGLQSERSAARHRQLRR